MSPLVYDDDDDWKDGGFRIWWYRRRRRRRRIYSLFSGISWSHHASLRWFVRWFVQVPAGSSFGLGRASLVPGDLRKCLENEPHSRHRQFDRLEARRSSLGSHFTYLLSVSYSSVSRETFKFVENAAFKRIFKKGWKSAVSSLFEDRKSPFSPASFVTASAGRNWEEPRSGSIWRSRPFLFFPRGKKRLSLYFSATYQQIDLLGRDCPRGNVAVGVKNERWLVCPLRFSWLRSAPSSTFNGQSTCSKWSLGRKWKHRWTTTTVSVSRERKKERKKERRKIDQLEKRLFLHRRASHFNQGALFSFLPSFFLSL